MKLLYVLTLFLLPIISLAPTAAALTINLNHNQSAVDFLAIGKPGFLKIKGSGGKVEGNVQFINSPKGSNLRGQAKVKLADFVTGMSLRDKHMKGKYLEVDKFPFATLEFNSDIPLQINAKMEDFAEEFKLTGSLTVHGVQRTIDFIYKLKKKGERLYYLTEFELDLVDYSIEIPSFLGVTVAKTVKVKVSGNSVIPLTMRERND